MSNIYIRLEKVTQEFIELKESIICYGNPEKNKIIEDDNINSQKDFHYIKKKLSINFQSDFSNIFK